MGGLLIVILGGTDVLTRGRFFDIGSSPTSYRKIVMRADEVEIVPCRSLTSAVAAGVNVPSALLSTVCSVDEASQITPKLGGGGKL
jgi:hypothetical protein